MHRSGIKTSQSHWLVKENRFKSFEGGMIASLFAMMRALLSFLLPSALCQMYILHMLLVLVLQHCQCLFTRGDNGMSDIAMSNASYHLPIWKDLLFVSRRHYIWSSLDILCVSFASMDSLELRRENKS